MIKLQNIKPEPLFESGQSPKSDIWDTNRTFKKGKNYLITAPSGKGKSTLLHVIYGLRKDFSGELFLNEKDSAGFPPEEWSELRQSRFSIIFQDLRLFPDLTAMGNIQLNANLASKITPQRIKEMAEQLDISELLEKPCGALSYGQRQRVAIIRALCQPFDFLLMDEPFSHLDDANIEKASALIDSEIKRQSAGLIMVSLGERFLFDYDFELIL
jgi:putative ABC transport system ATP-binding protein